MKEAYRLAAALLSAALLTIGGNGCRRAGPPSARPAAPHTDSVAVDSTSDVFSASSLPIPELGYNAREGRELYQHYCSNCHGDEGEGDGFNAYNLDPKPGSLADSAFQMKRSDADLLTAIRSGGTAVGLSTGMPPWGRTLGERQMENVVEYLRTLPEASHYQR